MKAFTELKRRQISAAVAPAPLPGKVFEYQLGKPARRQLRAVSALELVPPSDNKAIRMTTPMLTTEDFIQVRLATVRESTRHCYWPADVLARFAAADVIR
jgi:hypothetical protein